MTTLACLATGCAAPTLQPTIGTRPGPIKQLAATAGATKVGQSISKVFKPQTSVEPADAVSLKSKAKPFTADSYVKLGKVAEDANDIEGAREAYHKALKLTPHHLGALVGLGRIFERQGQYARATSHYLEATQFHNNDAGAFNDLGMCFARQRRYEDAVGALKRAVELQPDRELYRNNIAAALVKLNRIDEAMEHLTDARGQAVAHYNTGCLLHEEHRDPLALEHFQLALQAQPSLEQARQWIEELTTPPAVLDGPPEGVPAEIANVGAGEGRLAVDADLEPAAADLAVPELEPLPSTRRLTAPTSSSSPRRDAIVSDRVADAHDAETVAISDEHARDAAGSPDLSAEPLDVKASEPVFEARLLPLPPVDRKYRAASRY